jgi:FMN phosphatase YigB (HAD superfamily)
MKRSVLFLQFCTAIQFFYFSAFGAHIIFDLDGVLTRSNKLSFLWQVGPMRFVGLYNPFKIEHTLMRFLESLEPRRSETPLSFYHSNVLPQIMCDWLCGLKTSEEIRLLIEEKFETKNEFSSHKSFIKGITSVIFTPELFTKGISPIKTGIKFFKKCAAIVDDEGKPVHKLYILSNWAPESFVLLELIPELKELFELCQGIVISGTAHLMKPDVRIFEYLFSNFGIDPHTELTIFIDDQKINVAAARQLNKRQLHAFLCKNSEFKPIKKALKKLGIFPH